MKHFLPYVLILVLSLTLNISASADHIKGAEISYKCTNTPGMFEITLIVYRECIGIPACGGVCGSACSRSVSIVGADSGCASTALGSVTLSLTNVRDAASAPPTECPLSASSVCTNNGCTTPGSWPGVERYEFKGLTNLGPTSTIPSTCCKIKFVFDECCRSSHGYGFYVSASLNRCVTPCNSSPQFTNNPVLTSYASPYVYNMGAFDPDGDSLTYSFVPSYTSAGVSVVYPAPYGPATPFPWTGLASDPFPSGIHCDSRTGDIMFTPVLSTSGYFEGYLVVEVNQWRNINGVPTLIGSNTRDVTVQLGTGVPNYTTELQTSPPALPGSPDPKTKWNFCTGEQTCFTVTATDLDFSPPAISDTTYITWNGNISMAGTGATFLPTYDPTTRRMPAPLGGPREDNYQFCWTPTDAQARDQPYIFTVTSTEARCPVLSSITRAFSIKVTSVPKVSIVKNNLSCDNWTFTCQTIAPSVTPSSTIWTITRQPGDTSLSLNPYTFYNVTTTPTINFKKAGKYIVKLEAINGSSTSAASCSKFVYDTIVVDTPLSSPLRDTLACAGNTITINGLAQGGKAPYTYRWYNSINDTTAFSFPLNTPTLSSGALNVTSNTTRRYTLQTRDAKGCRGYDSLIVVRSTSVKDPVLANVLCNGTNTGSIEIKPTHPNTSYQYKLNNGGFQSSYIFNNLAAGTYDALVQDTNGCRRSFTGLVLSEPSTALKDSFTLTFDETCFNKHDGSIRTRGTGGVSPYLYKLDSGNYATVGIFTQLSNGVHTVQIKDANGCIFPVTQTIVKADSIGHSTAKTNITCFNQHNGEVALTVSGGKPPYSYKMDAGIFDSISIFNNIQSGTHIFQIKDANGCIKSFSEQLSQPSQLQPPYTKSNSTCYNHNDGLVTIMPTGGTAPYRYQTDSGPFDTLNTKANLEPGVHLFTVKDQNGCIVFFTETIAEPAQIIAGPVTGETDVTKDSIYSYEVLPSAGVNYLWKAEKGTIMTGQSSSSVTIKWDSTGAGLVSVLLYSDSACGDSSSQAVTIKEYVGLNEIALQLGLKVFPNPTKNILNITVKRLPSNATATLYDLQGKVLVQQPLKEQQQINIEHLSPGIYVVKIGDWHGQIVKQ